MHLYVYICICVKYIRDFRDMVYISYDLQY